jgi:heme iron utilization protein
VKTEDVALLRRLLMEQRILSLALIIDGEPHVGLMPYALARDLRSAFVHASRLAKHTRGLQLGARYSALIHATDTPDTDALSLPRVTLDGTVEPVGSESEAHGTARALYLDRFPDSAVTFELGDFGLYRLRFERGRLVGGFGRAANVTREMLDALTAEEA